MKVTCRACGHVQRVADELAGLKFPCSNCGHSLAIPRRKPVGDEAGGLPPKVGRSATANTPSDRGEVRRPAGKSAGQKKKSGLNAWQTAGVVALVVLMGVIRLAVRLNRAPVAPYAGASPSYMSAPVTPSGPPELGTFHSLGSGVQYSIVFSGGPPSSPRRRFDVYLPEGNHPDGSLPGVLIAPAGSNMLQGMDVGSGDRPEHLPYAKAGFAVVAYSLDGFFEGGQPTTDADVVRGYNEFRAADAGLANTRMALDFVLARLPQVDPRRISVAGHSSAGTLALLAAAREPRLRACVAYAACSDLEEHLAAALRDPALPRVLTDLPNFIRQSSPRTQIATLHCPVLLFHADDDSVAPVGMSIRYASEAKTLGKQVELIRVPHGDHYESMIHEGIPTGIRWLQSLPVADSPAAADSAEVDTSPDMAT